MNAFDSDSANGKLTSEFVKGRYVCVTGRLVSMTHADFAELIRCCGGTFVRHLKRCGHILILGAHGWPSESDGTPTQLFRRARELEACGYPIQFVSEDEFLEQLNFIETAQAIRGRHTIGDLSRILDVSPVRIRKWMRYQLIQPTESTYGLVRFDFDQVANAKHICELLEQGVSLRAIRNGIEDINKWLPQERLPLSQIALFEKRKVVLRFHGGLIESSGQRLFDFSDGIDQMVATVFPSPAHIGTIDQLFDQALECEDSGALEEAAAVYGQALLLDVSDQILHFNLGNVLFSLGRFEHSIQSFQAALEIDPCYAEAWNNLGSAYAELNQWDKAENAFTKALRLIPTYADAHFNLADVLKQVGETARSIEHHQAYRHLSSAERLQSGHIKLMRLVRPSDIT